MKCFVQGDNLNEWHEAADYQLSCYSKYLQTNDCKKLITQELVGDQLGWIAQTLVRLVFEKIDDKFYIGQPLGRRRRFLVFNNDLAILLPKHNGAPLRVDLFAK